MALDLVPSRLPSLEGYKTALRAAIAEQWADAAAAVAAAYPDPDIALDAPREVTTELIERYDAIRLWPTVAILGSVETMSTPADQLGHGLWEGQVAVEAHLHENARLADGRPRLPYLAERYMAALWLVVINHEQLAGVRVMNDGMTFSEVGGGQVNGRHVGSFALAYKVRLRT